MQMRAKCYVMSEASESQVSCDGDGALWLNATPAYAFTWL